MYLFKLSNNLIILGTNHDISYEALPEKIRREVESAQILYDESSSAQLLQRTSPYIHFIKNYKGLKESQNYEIVLPSFIKNKICEQLVESFDRAFHFEDLSLKGIELILRSVKSGSASPSMDTEIAKMFCNSGKQGYSLETETSSEVEKAIQAYDPLEVIKHLYKTTIPKEDPDYLSQNYSLTLLNIVGSSTIVKGRTLEWDSILQARGLYESELTKTLLSVGVTHTIGDFGLLNLFQDKGIIVQEAYDLPSNSFIPFGAWFASCQAKDPYKDMDLGDMSAQQAMSIEPLVLEIGKSLILEESYIQAQKVIVKTGSGALHLREGGGIKGPGSLVFEQLHTSIYYDSLSNLTVAVIDGKAVIILNKEIFTGPEVRSIVESCFSTYSAQYTIAELIMEYSRESDQLIKEYISSSGQVHKILDDVLSKNAIGLIEDYYHDY